MIPFTEKEVITMQSKTLQLQAEELERRTLGADTEKIMDELDKLRKEAPLLRGSNMALARDVEFYGKQVDSWKIKWMDIKMERDEARANVTSWQEISGMMSISRNRWRLCAYINMSLLLINAILHVVIMLRGSSV